MVRGAAGAEGRLIHRLARSLLAAVIAAVAAPAPSSADEPLPPPARHAVCSRSGDYCATSDPEIGTFVHPAGSADRSTALWAIPGWYRALWIADDGRHLVTGYNGLNLVPKDRPSATVVVEFWRSGELIESYTLDELGYPRRRLDQTVSHYHWGGYVGIGDDGRFRLAMLDGVRLVFDPTSGELVERQQRNAGSEVGEDE